MTDVNPEYVMIYAVDNRLKELEAQELTAEIKDQIAGRGKHPYLVPPRAAEHPGDAPGGRQYAPEQLPPRMQQVYANGLHGAGRVTRALPDIGSPWLAAVAFCVAKHGNFQNFFFFEKFCNKNCLSNV